MTLTTETLNDFIAGQGFGVAPSAVEAMARELLASREAQPVAWRHDDGPFAGIAITRSKSVADNWIANGWTVTPLYTAPPAPAVPGIDDLRLTFERAERESDDGFNLHKYGIGYADEATQARWESWLACRAAMLKGERP